MTGGGDQRRTLISKAKENLPSSWAQGGSLQPSNQRQKRKRPAAEPSQKKKKEEKNKKKKKKNKKKKKKRKKKKEKRGRRGEEKRREKKKKKKTEKENWHEMTRNLTKIEGPIRNSGGRKVPNSFFQGQKKKILQTIGGYSLAEMFNNRDFPTRKSNGNGRVGNLRVKGNEGGKKRVNAKSGLNGQSG